VLAEAARRALGPVDIFIYAQSVVRFPRVDINGPFATDSRHALAADAGVTMVG